VPQLLLIITLNTLVGLH